MQFRGDIITQLGKTDKMLKPAINSGNLQFFQTLMRTRIKIIGNSALHTVFIDGELIDQTPFYAVALSPNRHKIAMLTWLLEAGADVNAKSGFGKFDSLSETPLLAAAYWGLFDVFKFLIESGKVDLDHPAQTPTKLLYTANFNRLPNDRLPNETQEHKKISAYLIARYLISPWDIVSYTQGQLKPLIEEVALNDADDITMLKEFIEVCNEAGLLVDLSTQVKIPNPTSEEPEYSLPLLAAVLLAGTFKVAEYLINTLRLDLNKKIEQGEWLFGSPIDLFKSRVTNFISVYQDTDEQEEELEAIIRIASLLLDKDDFLKGKTTNSLQQRVSYLSYILVDLIADFNENKSCQLAKIMTVMDILSKAYPELQWANYNESCSIICSNHKPYVEAKRIFDDILELDPNTDSPYTLEEENNEYYIAVEVDKLNFNSLSFILLSRSVTSRVNWFSSTSAPAAAVTFHGESRVTVSEKVTDEEEQLEARENNLM